LRRSVKGVNGRSGCTRASEIGEEGKESVSEGKKKKQKTKRGKHGLFVVQQDDGLYSHTSHAIHLPRHPVVAPVTYPGSFAALKASALL
jgi:hypothetical protein